MTLPDLWAECYTPEHRKLGNPEEFRATFCDKCVNPGCRNSAAAGTKWSRRMASQEDNLLRNPRFADPNDPAHREIRNLDWENALRQALAIEVSARKGDWSVATESEIGRAAAEMVGMAPPSFSPPPEPEPEPKPLTAKELIIKIREANSLEELEGIVPDGETRVSVLRVLDSKKKSLEAPEPVEEEAEPEPTPDNPIQGRWRVQGDSTDKNGKKQIYEVTLYANGQWECDCPSRKRPCKHVMDISRRLANSPPESPKDEPAAPTATAPVAPPPPARFRTPRNTAQPSEGIMVGGGPPPEPEDPWAPKKKNTKDRVIGVGGTVRFGSKDRGD